MKNNKGVADVLAMVIGGYVFLGVVGYPFYKAGLIGEGSKHAQVGKVQFKDANGSVTTERNQAWFNQDKP